jgi:hypothetical protein
MIIKIYHKSMKLCQKVHLILRETPCFLLKGHCFAFSKHIDGTAIAMNCHNTYFLWPGCTGANPGYKTVNVGLAYGRVVGENIFSATTNHSLLIFCIQH